MGDPAGAAAAAAIISLSDFPLHKSQIEKSGQAKGELDKNTFNSLLTAGSVEF